MASCRLRGGPRGPNARRTMTSRASASASAPAAGPVASGLAPAITAYLIWGFLPLYLLLVKSVPAFEFVGWRIIWTLPLCLAIVAWRRQFPELLAALRSPKSLLALLASAAGEVYATSIGYYLNPLLNVLLGTLLLGERLSRRQWLAVAIASLAVAVLATGTETMTSLWISLTLGLSFAVYGLVRKQVAVGSLPGLTIESAILLPAAIAIAAWYAGTPAGSAFGQDLWMSALIVFSGVVTAVPLLLFALAARRMDYSTLGFLQYIAPTIVFLLGLFVFHQPLAPAKLGCFVLIWVAVGVFVWDLWARRRSAA